MHLGVQAQELVQGETTISPTYETKASIREVAIDPIYEKRTNVEPIPYNEVAIDPIYEEVTILEPIIDPKVRIDPEITTEVVSCPMGETVMAGSELYLEDYTEDYLFVSAE